MDFFHILVDDNSPEIPPIEIKDNRIILALRNDVDPQKHVMQLGKCVDLALDYARNNFEFDNFFYVESDVMPMKDFDIKMLEISDKLSDWATLDVLSVHPDTGATTYPCTVNHRKASISEEDLLDELVYTDFQCMLMKKEMLDLFRFNDFQSHWDIMVSRKLTELTGLRHYRTRQVAARHYGGASRESLPK